MGKFYRLTTAQRPRRRYACVQFAVDTQSRSTPSRHIASRSNLIFRSVRPKSWRVECRSLGRSIGRACARIGGRGDFERGGLASLGKTHAAGSVAHASYKSWRSLRNRKRRAESKRSPPPVPLRGSEGTSGE